MAKITYDDKVALIENADIPDINKVKADDINEIKSVVNENDDKFLTNGLNISTDVDEDYRVNFIKGKNLFDENVITNLWSEYGTGNIINANGANLQRFNCQEGDTFTLKATFNNPDNSSIILIAFYSSNGTLLSRTAQNTIFELPLTAPANTAYMYAGHYTKKPDTIMLNKGSTSTTYEPYVTPSIYVDNEEIYSKGNLEQYSTGEIRIGTWIDGKPLYRKVIDIGALPNNTQKAITHNISNIQTITKVSGYCTNSNIYFPLPNVNTTIDLQIAVYSTKTQVIVNTGTDRSSYSGYVVLEYTKTTD